MGVDMDFGSSRNDGGCLEETWLRTSNDSTFENGFFFWGGRRRVPTPPSRIERPLSIFVDTGNVLYGSGGGGDRVTLRLGVATDLSTLWESQDLSGSRGDPSRSPFSAHLWCPWLSDITSSNAAQICAAPSSPTMSIRPRKARGWGTSSWPCSPVPGVLGGGRASPLVQLTQMLIVMRPVWSTRLPCPE